MNTPENYRNNDYIKHNVQYIRNNINSYCTFLNWPELHACYCYIFKYLLASIICKNNGLLTNYYSILRGSGVVHRVSVNQATQQNTSCLKRHCLLFWNFATTVIDRLSVHVWVSVHSPFRNESIFPASIFKHLLRDFEMFSQRSALLITNHNS